MLEVQATNLCATVAKKPLQIQDNEFIMVSIIIYDKSALLHHKHSIRTAYYHKYSMMTFSKNIGEILKIWHKLWYGNSIPKNTTFDGNVGKSLKI